MTTSTEPLGLASMSLRKAERGLVIGGSGSGKSTLIEYLIRDWLARYTKAGTRVLVVDTKPRFRATWTAQGTSAKRLYRHWDHGPELPGSVVVTNPADMAHAWTLGTSVVIAQGPAESDLPNMTGCIDGFLAQSRVSRPQLLVVDETLDFFNASGQSVRGTTDALKRVARAGRERGTAALYGSQRTKGLPVQLVSELSKLYLFRLDFVEDTSRLRDAGFPAGQWPPEHDHQFRYWTKKDRAVVYGPYQLRHSGG